MYAHNGSRYDFPLLVNGIAQLLNYTFTQFHKNGKIVKTPFFSKVPTILFRDTETPLCIRFRFSCTKINSCTKCSLSSKEKEEYYKNFNEPLSCPFTREIVLLDSYAHVGYSLGAIVDDLNATAIKTNQPLKDIFATTYTYVTKRGYTDEQFEFLVRKKMIMPFQKMDSLNYMLQQTAIPPRDHFTGPLKPDLDEDGYHNFVTIWRLLDIQNLYELVALYAGLDTAELLDAMVYYHDQIYKIIGLYPTHYQTISSLAASSFLRHNKDPVEKHSSLKLELLSEDLFQLFTECLRGGYSCTFAHYVNSSYGYGEQQRFKCANYLDWKLVKTSLCYAPVRSVRSSVYTSIELSIKNTHTHKT